MIAAGDDVGAAVDGFRAQHGTDPRLFLVPGAGVVAAAPDARAARARLEIGAHTHASVAATLDRFGDASWLDDDEVHDFEYWPLELYKLTLAPPPPELAGRIALVTGAASGIGRDIALDLAARGAHLVLADLDASGLAETAEGLGGRAETVVGDLTDTGVVDRAVHTAVGSFGGLDAVVFNAGIASTGPLETVPEEQWRRSLEVNLSAHFVLTRRVLGLLREQAIGGSLVYVASKNAFAPGAGFGPYSVAKAGLVQLMRIAALEGGPLGVRANAVNPDAIFGGRSSGRTRSARSAQRRTGSRSTRSSRSMRRGACSAARSPAPMSRRRSPSWSPTGRRQRQARSSRWTAASRPRSPADRLCSPSYEVNPGRLQHLRPMASKSKTASIGRVGEIVQVAVKHGFGSLLEGRRTPAEVDAIRGRHLREMFDELGPTFVKFGQLLSTRPDIVPEDIIVELRGLQNDVTPFPFADVERVIAEDLKQPIGRLFVEFDELPMAAASIGQVHRALLPNGRQVAVKVQRPNAPRQVESDIQLLEQAARFIKERVHALDFVDSREVVDEFARSLRQELDYRQEASNARVFHRNFSGHPHVVVPRLYASYSSQRVLTLEYLEGVQLADLQTDDWTVDQRRRLAYVIAETWLTMIFRHGFFHGDPHPANILVLAPDKIGLVDFGLAGKLTDSDLSKLTSLFIDAANENVEALPRRLADLGVRYPKDKEAEFVAELHTIYSRYYGASMKDIDPLQVIREAFGLIYKMNIRLPSRFVMLDKAIATIGSVGVELYPDFNVFEVARPYARGARAGAILARPGCQARPPRDQPVRPGGVGAAVPALRDARAGAGRRDRVRVRAQGARRPDAQARRDLQPPRDRADRRRRADRVEPDRDLREDRAARARSERRVRIRVHRLRRARNLAARRGYPLRPALSRGGCAGHDPARRGEDESSQFRPKGHLAPGEIRRYRRTMSTVEQQLREQGFDDELVERIRAVLQPERTWRAGDLTIDESARVASIRGLPLKLSHKEFQLLVKLASDPRASSRAPSSSATSGTGPRRCAPARSTRTPPAFAASCGLSIPQPPTSTTSGESVTGSSVPTRSSNLEGVTRAEQFRRFHRTPPLLVLLNAWDVASAKTFAGLPGCRAIATTSAAVARSLGWEDREQAPVEEMLKVIERSCARSTSPSPPTSRPATATRRAPPPQRSRSAQPE